jgi:hypothetical protein
VLAFADVMDFLANELTGLRARRLALPFVPPRSLDSFAFWHEFLDFYLCRWLRGSRSKVSSSGTGAFLSRSRSLASVDVFAIASP